MVITSEFYCIECGNKGIPLPRKASMQRKKHHLKKIYCVHCMEEVNHVEIRPIDVGVEAMESIELIKTLLKQYKEFSIERESCKRKDCEHCTELEKKLDQIYYALKMEGIIPLKYGESYTGGKYGR